MTTMDWKTGAKEELAFLREQMRHVDQKITRINHALAVCDGGTEGKGLQSSLHNAQIERDVLIDLLQEHLDRESVSLDTLIMQRSDKCRREEARLAQHWHRGRPTPSGYWDAEIERAALSDLLRRYHAWHAGRPYYAEPSLVGSGNGHGAPNGKNGKSGEQEMEYVHPWYIAPSRRPKPVATPEYHEPKKARSHDPLEAIRETLAEALEKDGYPANHLDMIVQPDGQVIVTGYAHSEEQRINALTAIIMVDDVLELLTDIKVVEPEDCPICHPAIVEPEQDQD